MACAYRGCEQRYKAFASINFFSLPADNRRDKWILNSGNSKLKMVPTGTKVRFCEDHFAPKYFRRQFNRTTLRRDAIPYNYYEINECNPSSEDTSINSLDMSEEDKCTTNVKKGEAIQLVTEVEFSSLLHADTANQQTTISSENFLENYLDQTELVEPVSDEIVCPEIEKTFFDASIQTDDLARPVLATNEYDEDEHFILSLIGPLRRLPNHMKISARLSILEIIARCESQTK